MVAQAVDREILHRNEVRQPEPAVIERRGSRREPGLAERQFHEPGTHVDVAVPAQRVRDRAVVEVHPQPQSRVVDLRPTRRILRKEERIRIDGGGEEIAPVARAACVQVRQFRQREQPVLLVGPPRPLCSSRSAAAGCFLNRSSRLSRASNCAVQALGRSPVSALTVSCRWISSSPADFTPTGVAHPATAMTRSGWENFES